LPDSHSSHKLLSQSRAGEIVWPVVMAETPNTPWVFKNLLPDHRLQEASGGQMYFPNFYVVSLDRQLLFLRTSCRYT